MSRSSACALLLLGLAVLAPARAQTAPVIAPDRPLTLEDAIALAVRKNFNLQIQGNNLERTKDSLEIARAPFDPVISGSFSKSYNKSAARTSLLEGTASDNTSFGARVSQLLPWTNGTVSLGTSPNLSRNASNNVNDLFNPSYGVGFGITYNQSLRNFGSEAATANLQSAKLGLGIAHINYRNQVLSLITSVENAYFDLVAQRDQLRIRQASLALADRGLSESNARLNTGLVIPLEVLTQEVAVATARQNVLLSEQAVRNAEENLLNLINVPEFDSRPGPVRFDDYTEGVPNVAASYKIASERYPPTLSAMERLKQLQITLETNRRNLRPELNLQAAAGYSGRSSNQSYWTVLENLPSDHGRSWSFSLNYTLPWGRRADKARLRQAQLDINDQKLTIEQLEQQLSVQVRQAIRTIETNIVAVEIATKRVQLAEQQYDQQKARFDSGLTTSRQVQQFQDDLEASRVAELSAKLTLRRAAAALRQLEGTSIERYRIQLPQ